MVLIIDLIFVGAWIVFASFIVTQILLPTFRGTKLFPIFRTKVRQANRAMTEAREASYEASLEEEARRVAAERLKDKGSRKATDIIDITPFDKRP